MQALVSHVQNLVLEELAQSYSNPRPLIKRWYRDLHAARNAAEPGYRTGPPCREAKNPQKGGVVLIWRWRWRVFRSQPIPIQDTGKPGLQVRWSEFSWKQIACLPGIFPTAPVEDSVLNYVNRAAFKYFCVPNNFEAQNRSAGDYYQG